MDKRKLWSRVLVVAGLAAMLVGAIDPLEGSLVILPGSVLVTVGALLFGTRYKKLILWSLALGVERRRGLRGPRGRRPAFILVGARPCTFPGRLGHGRRWRHFETSRAEVTS